MKNLTILTMFAAITAISCSDAPQANRVKSASIQDGNAILMVRSDDGNGVDFYRCQGLPQESLSEIKTDVELLGKFDDQCSHVHSEEKSIVAKRSIAHLATVFASEIKTLKASLENPEATTAMVDMLLKQTHVVDPERPDRDKVSFPDSLVDLHFTYTRGASKEMVIELYQMIATQLIQQLENMITTFEASANEEAIQNTILAKMTNPIEITFNKNSYDMALEFLAVMQAPTVSETAPESSE